MLINKQHNAFFVNLELSASGPNLPHIFFNTSLNTQTSLLFLDLRIIPSTFIPNPKPPLILPPNTTILFLISIIDNIQMNNQTKSIEFHNTRVLPEYDVCIHTSDGTRIPAHTSILASVSPVFENILEQPRKQRSSERIIKIHGVPSTAVTAFINFLYSSRCTEDEMDKYGIHLLALSHVYNVPQLKQKCIKGLVQRLTIENVVDVLQLARLCDAPDLRLRCMKLLTNHFNAVQKSEGWKFLTKHDPWLELDILHFMDESETRREKLRRHREEQGLYAELSEAMECLEHICTEGCTDVGPYHVEVDRERKPCSKFSTCQGLQLLIRHFATCKRRVKGGCWRCKRMWQLFRLHSYVCQQTDDSCNVPLCRQFQLKMEQEKRKDDPKWKLLARKVASAKVMFSLSLPKRKRDEEMRVAIDNRGIRCFGYNEYCNNVKDNRCISC